MSQCRWCDEGRPFLPGSDNKQHLPLFAGGEHAGTMCHNSSIYNGSTALLELARRVIATDPYLEFVAAEIEPLAQFVADRLTPVEMKPRILEPHHSFHSGVCACGTVLRTAPMKYCYECGRPVKWI